MQALLVGLLKSVVCVSSNAFRQGIGLMCQDNRWQPGHSIPYATVKDGGRFGAELQASAQAKLAQAAQQQNENMEDRADRIQALAVEAFRNLPEDYCNQQAIDRFCQGLIDTGAGHSAFMKQHNTIEAAMNYVRLFQHSKKAMVGQGDH